jgi:KipI family sensor histidine kinase inhibitor
MRILRCGERAVLVEVDGLPQVRALQAVLEAARPAGVRELVPGAATLLVRYDPAVRGFAQLAGELEALAGKPGPRPHLPHPGADLGATPVVELPTRYDGPDLADVARLTRLSEQEVITRHTAPEYLAAFCGFSPGFAYLTGGDPVLQVPRHATSRTKVAAGSVAIAGGYSAAYPREGPGGWRLIGRTATPLWDLAADPPALLLPGTRVRFREVDDR